jgi:serine/threonine-protein phosphatase 2B regulatory subunit
MTPEGLEQLRQETGLDEIALKRLIKSFKSIDADHSGTLSVEEFMAIPELKNNPLVERVARCFDTDGNGNVDFREFAKVLGTFANTAGTTGLEKAKCKHDYCGICCRIDVLV